MYIVHVVGSTYRFVQRS